MAMMNPDDFIDFSGGMEDTDAAVPNESCEYCVKEHIHCQVTPETINLGGCKPCIEAKRNCTLPSNMGPPMSVLEPLESFADFGAAGNERQDQLQQLSESSYSRSESSFTGNDSLGEDSTGGLDTTPKIGARFSREALRILRNWLLSNHRHPYPNNEEKENLARQTGLNKTQISTWVANARRRGKVRAPRSTSSSPGQLNNAIDIPQKKTTMTRGMSPMERWRHSPPDQEPASITAIASAVSSAGFPVGAGAASASYKDMDDRLLGSIDHLSSAGSSKTSHSGNGSQSSAISHKSRESLESLYSLKSRGRRRRRRQIPKAVDISTILPSVHKYQCTFCTETFKTKHDWQRHEKSLHLSLEQWVCSPNGPIQFCAEWDCLACVYCGLKNPSPEHAEQHNDFVCHGRPDAEKTFFRKDHLRQHLSIVHDAKFQKWPMSDWKVDTPAVRSRCGFCGIILYSWDSRVGHLAQHFKMGKSMADWKGDWGFQGEILKIVENGMPPYLIHHERNTLDPFEASKDEVRHGKTLEDHVKLWLIDYMNKRAVAGMAATDDQLLIEAQRVVQKVDTEDTSLTGPDISWFRDLIMLHKPSSHMTQEELYRASGITSWTSQIEKMKTSKSTHTDMSTIGDEKEKLLLRHVKSRQAAGQIPTDAELQFQACKILDDVEPKSNFKCKEAVQWFKFLINSSSDWLSAFKRRAGVLSNAETSYGHMQPGIQDIITNGEHHLSVLRQDSLLGGISPSQIPGTATLGGEMQFESNVILAGDGNQTILSELSDLGAPEERNDLLASLDDTLIAAHESGDLTSTHQAKDTKTGATPSPKALHWGVPDEAIGCTSPMDTNDYLPGLTETPHSANSHPSHHQPLRYFLSDANCYGRLEKELTRFVTSCLSSNNPLQHIPTDEEIQYQARWIIYDDDDPWNQTAADNVEWLARFKRDVGITAADNSSGLPLNGPPRPWRVTDGGTGLTPPYLKPKPGKVIEVADEASVLIDHRFYNVNKDTAERYVRALCEGEYQFPPSVFCSRELEDGLNAYIEDCMKNLYVPSDDDLRAKAREILGVERTAADDPKLLETFKAMHVLWHTTNNDFIPDGHPNSNTLDFMDSVDVLASDPEQLNAFDLNAEFSTRLGV
ncbi:hypothetical protein Trisim1_002824 [Trichoderma cf. simile WF8]